MSVQGIEHALVVVLGCLDEHSELLTGVATVFIAAFTYTLWRATTRLWRAHERSFTELERPWVHFTPTRDTLDKFWGKITSAGIQLPITESIEVDIAFANYGKVPAVITALYCSFEYRDGPPHSKAAAKQPLKGNPIICPGRSIIAATVWMQGTFDVQHIASFRESRQQIWLWGRLTYQNAGGPPDPKSDRETEFLWVFDGPKKRFAPSDEGGPSRNRRT